MRGRAVKAGINWLDMYREFAFTVAIKFADKCKDLWIAPVTIFS